MSRRTYQEKTNDHGVPKYSEASDNNAVYILTSAMAKDMLIEYYERYDRDPTAAWFNRHFSFERVK